jgi:hypothetical protein
LGLVPSTECGGSLSIGLFVVGDVSLALLDPVVQLGLKLGKVESLASHDCADGGKQADVGNSEMA